MTSTTQILRKARQPASVFVQKLLMWRNPVLAHPISSRTDEEIDTALTRAGLARKDLFTPGGAIAQYRLRMACMLQALGIKVDLAVNEHWAAFKKADGKCSRCAETGRCHRWLEWGRPTAAPTMFCPNARLFLSIVEEQVESRARDNM